MYTHRTAESEIIPKIVTAVDGLFEAQDSLINQLDIIYGVFYLIFGILFVLCCCVLYIAFKLRKQL